MRKHFLLPYNDKSVNPQTGEYSPIQTVTIYAKIMSDSHKFQHYPHLNTGVDP